MNVFLRLAWSYLKIGIFGFGGGYAMLSLIEREIVGGGFITGQTFTDIVAVSQMTPGPIGINSATYIGYTVGSGWLGAVGWGLLGAVLCTVVVVLPSMLMVLTADTYIERHRESVWIKGIFRGLRPVVPGLIAAAALLLMNAENFGTGWRDVSVSAAIALAVFALARLTRIHPIALIVASGVAGWLLF